MKRITTPLVTLISLITILSSSLPALAATAAKPAPAPTKTPTNGQALEIAPPVINLTANPGQSIKTQIFLRNISSGDLIVTGQSNDFVAAGQDGTPKLLLDTDKVSPYSLKNWVSGLPSLRIAPREIKTMAVTINVPTNASPGGHYGVIRFTATPAGVQGSGVSLSASLGALVLMTVNGNIKENLSVSEFSVANPNGKGSLFEAGPLQFSELIKNNGNVHERPVGQVSITNMFGKKIAAVNVNLPPGNILPASSRKFEQPLDKAVLGNKKLFGHYQAKLSVTYGANKKVLSDNLSFWVIPYKLIILLALLLVALFFGLRYLLKWYNRRIITKAQGPRPPSANNPPNPDNRS